MSDEPTERDVEDLALVVGGSNPRTGHVYIDGNDGCKAAARAVLASDWYAERIAQARREGAAEALSEAADDAVPRFNNHPLNRRNAVAAWLDRRAALRGDA